MKVTILFLPCSFERVVEIYVQLYVVETTLQKEKRRVIIKTKPQTYRYSCNYFASYLKLVLNSIRTFLRIDFCQGIIHYKHIKNNFLSFSTIIATFRHLSCHPIRCFIAPGGISGPHIAFALPALLSKLYSPLGYMVTESVYKLHQVGDVFFRLTFFT